MMAIVICGALGFAIFSSPAARRARRATPGVEEILHDMDSLVLSSDPVGNTSRTKSADEHSAPVQQNATLSWLNILDIENIGHCCEGWPESDLRGIVAVTWQCKSRPVAMQALPWQCRNSTQSHTLFFYSSSGTNSAAEMKDTWTPFSTYFSNMFQKLQWETCWSYWKNISEELYDLRAEFVRFGTTNRTQMPDYSPVELVTISHALGGGFWDTSRGYALASSLGISGFPNDLAPKAQAIITETQLEDRTKQGDDGSALGSFLQLEPPPMFFRSGPQFHKDAEGC